MIGKNAGNCLYDQRKYFDKITHPTKSKDDDEESDIDDTKSALPKTDECDVLSVVESKVQKKSVKQKHLSAKVNRKFAQCYMQSAWQDVEFINGLKADEILSKSTQNAASFDAINREIDDCVEKTKKLIVR